MLKRFNMLLFCIAASAAAFAQNQGAESALAQIHGKVLVLRHPLLNNFQSYASDGKDLDGSEDGPWTVYGGILIDKTSLTPDQLRIEGRRTLFLFQHHQFKAMDFKRRRADREPPFPAEMKLEIHLGSALDTAEQAQAVLGRVFALNTTDLLASVPEPWRKCLDGYLTYDPWQEREAEFGWQEPPPISRKPGQMEKKIKPHDDKQSADVMQPVFHVGEGVTAPSPTFTPEPQYSEIARYEKFQGSLILNVILGNDGVVHQVRVVRPLGLGLDEAAQSTVKTWHFLPATKDGQPVAVEMNVEVAFHLY
jgi:TonB family protein